MASRAPADASGPRVVMLSPDPAHPGGITKLIGSWTEAGLGERCRLRHLHTSRWDDPKPLQLLQAIRAMVVLIGLLLARRVDLVHLHASVGGSLARKALAAILCRPFGIPVVAQLHSGQFERVVAEGGAQRKLAAALARRSAALLVLDPRWISLGGELGAGRIEVVPNCIGVAERERFERLRESRSSGGEPPRILFFGRWAPIKGLDRLAGALERLGERDYALRVFGNGDREWAAGLLARLGDRAELGGWLDLEGKAAELGEADLYVLPSRSEAFGVSVLEAMAAGVPIIASGAGAVPTALSRYEPRICFDPDSDAELEAALRSFLEGEWPPEGWRPAPFDERFTAERAVESLASLYHDLGGARGR